MVVTLEKTPGFQNEGCDHGLKYILLSGQKDFSLLCFLKASDQPPRSDTRLLSHKDRVGCFFKYFQILEPWLVECTTRTGGCEDTRCNNVS